MSSTDRVLDNHAAAARLREAAHTLARDMPAGRERETVLSLVGLAAHRLESDHEIRLCLRCGREYSFDPRVYVRRGQQLPKYCFDCRRARQEERRQAIEGGLIAPEIY